MPMQAPSWHPPATCCASSSRERYWECRCSDSETSAKKAEGGMSNVKEDRTRGQTIWVGAVAYDPKVVTIWEGMRRYFHEEVHLPVEIVLFQSYDAQVAALLASPSDLLPRIDIAWNTNLAFLQADEWSGHRGEPITSRDTDLAWRRRIAEGSGGALRARDAL